MQLLKGRILLINFPNGYIQYMRKFWVTLLVAVLTVLFAAIIFAVILTLMTLLFGGSDKSWLVILKQSAFQGLIFGIVMYFFFVISNHIKPGKKKSGKE